MAGATAGMITMSLHPSGNHGIMSQGDMRALALLTKAVHGLGILSLPLTFLGALALTRRLATPNRLAVAALVVDGFAAQEGRGGLSRMYGGGGGWGREVGGRQAERGLAVRIVTRDPAHAQPLRSRFPELVEIVLGDVRDAATVERAAARGWTTR